jgi:hypothetical protein
MKNCAKIVPPHHPNAISIVMIIFAKCRRPWLVFVDYFFGKQLAKSMGGREKPDTV